MFDMWQGNTGHHRICDVEQVKPQHVGCFCITCFVCIPVISPTQYQNSFTINIRMGNVSSWSIWKSLILAKSVPRGTVTYLCADIRNHAAPSRSHSGIALYFAALYRPRLFFRLQYCVVQTETGLATETVSYSAKITLSSRHIERPRTTFASHFLDHARFLLWFGIIHCKS